MARSEITVKRFESAWGEAIADETSTTDYRDPWDQANEHVFTHPGPGHIVQLRIVNGSGNNGTVTVTAPAQPRTYNIARPLAVTVADGKTGLMSIPYFYAQADGTVQVDLAAAGNTSSYFVATCITAPRL